MDRLADRLTAVSSTVYRLRQPGQTVSVHLMKGHVIIVMQRNSVEILRMFTLGK